MRVKELREYLESFPDSAQVMIDMRSNVKAELKPQIVMGLHGADFSVVLTDYVLEQHREKLVIHGEEFEVIYHA